VGSFSFFYAVVAATSMLSGYAVVGLWTRISEEQLHRVRVAYLGAVLRQEVGWIDARQPDALSAQVRNRHT